MLRPFVALCCVFSFYLNRAVAWSGLAPKVSMCAPPRPIGQRGGLCSRRPIVVDAVSLAVLLTVAGVPMPPATVAAADCDVDCLKNCNRIAPGNEAYCRSECAEYCEQPDRRDGLSGSVSSENGYVGLASPLRGGDTVEFGADVPPQAPEIFRPFGETVAPKQQQQQPR